MNERQSKTAEELEGYGIDTATATSLVHDFSEKELRRAVDMMQVTPGIQSPAGWLITVLRNGSAEDKAKKRGKIEKKDSCGECDDGLILFTAMRSGREYQRVAACRCPRGHQRASVKFGGRKMLYYDSVTAGAYTGGDALSFPPAVPPSASPPPVSVSQLTDARPF